MNDQIADDYVDYLSDAARSENAVLHEFRILYYTDTTSLHLFFEGGEDRVYYTPSIRQRVGALYHCYDCGGKPHVIEIRSAVLRITQEGERCLFFIDRDHDAFLSANGEQVARTYVTDFYSTENDVTTKEAVEILLCDIGGATRSQPEFETAMRGFARAAGTFCNSIKPIMAWVIAARKDKIKVNLNNVELSDVFIRDKKGLWRRKECAFEVFSRQVGAADYLPECSLYKLTLRNLSKSDERLWLRGKYALWFFTKELQFQFAQLSGKKSGHGKKIKIPRTLAQNAIFETLSARVRRPDSLTAFLDLHLPL